VERSSLGTVLSRQNLRLPVVSALLGLFAIGLLPWALWLSWWLPSRQVAAHWDVAWSGFDLGLAGALFATAYAAARRRPWLDRIATVTGTLLVCDAWFDALTASTLTEFAFAAALLAVELPLAAVCFLIAARAHAIR
jgi:hypothetical protein